MKWMTKLRLINWHYFTDATVEFGKQTLITGQNGSGKSTIIDALQVLFVADQRQIRFNAAAIDEPKRNFINYLKGKIGNDDRSFLREGDFTTYIAAEFRDDDKKELFVVGLVVDVYRGDRKYEDEYFILANMKLDDLELVGANNRLLNRGEFKSRYGRTLDSVGPGDNRNKVFFERNRSNYQKALLARMGQVHDRFFRVFTKALSFKPIQDIRAFVYDYILDKRELQLDLMKQNFEIHERYRMELDQLQARKVQLQDIRDQYQKYVQYRETAKEQEYVIRRLRAVLEMETLARLNETKRLTAERLAQGQSDIRLAELKRAEAAEHKQSAYQRWQSDEAGRRKRELDVELRELAGRRTELVRLIATFQSQLRQETKLLHDVFAWQGNEFWAWDVGERERLDELQDTMASLMVIVEHGVVEAHEEELWADRLMAVGEMISLWHDRFFTAETKRQDVQKSVQEETVELQQVIRDLEQKRRSYQEPVRRLKALLEDRLQGKSPVWVFCEEVELNDENWRNALEGYLNTQRFDLLVQPEWFTAALGVYEQEKWSYKLEGVGLVDTDKERRYLNTTEPGSLAAELQTEHPVIRAHTEHLLGRVMKAANEQELRKHRTAVTQSCMVYNNLTARQIPKKQYEMPYLGGKAIEKQLEIFRAQLQEAANKLAELLRLAKEFQPFLRDMREKRSHYARIASNLGLMHDLWDCGARINEAQEELQRLDLSEANMLESEFRKWEVAEQEWTRRWGALQVEEGKLTEQTARLEGDLKLQRQKVNEREADWCRWVEEHGAESEERAQKRWEEAKRQSTETLQKLRNFERNFAGQQTQRDNQFAQVAKLRSEYNVGQAYGGDVNAISNDAYEELLDKIDTLDIPDYQEKVSAALKESEEEFKSHFIFKLREAIEMARREFGGLNHALRHFPFSSDKYHFEISAHDRYKKFYDAVMDPLLMERGSLFDLPDNDRTAVLHVLFEKLVRGEAGQLEEFTDYRQYLDFDILVTTGDNKPYHFSRVLKEKSGGETQTPFYIAILASFHHLYSKKSLRLVVFDEAFNKMDEERIQSSLRLIKQMELQLIAAVPDEKMQYMAPEMSTTLFVSKHDYHCYVDMIDRLREDEDAMTDIAIVASEDARARQDTLF
jgi:uncharacterized protein YPO0396